MLSAGPRLHETRGAAEESKGVTESASGGAGTGEPARAETAPPLLWRGVYE